MKSLTIVSVKCVKLSSGSSGYPDDLYIKVNGSKVWPSGKLYESIGLQQTKAVGYTLPLGDKVTIQLWDSDKVSADDLLGYLNLGEDGSFKDGSFTYLVQNGDEDSNGSIYEINIKIS